MEDYDFEQEIIACLAEMEAAGYASMAPGYKRALEKRMVRATKAYCVKHGGSREGAVHDAIENTNNGRADEDEKQMAEAARWRRVWRAGSESDEELATDVAQNATLMAASKTIIPILTNMFYFFKVPQNTMLKYDAGDCATYDVYNPLQGARVRLQKFVLASARVISTDDEGIPSVNRKWRGRVGTKKRVGNLDRYVIGNGTATLALEVYPTNPAWVKGVHMFNDPEARIALLQLCLRGTGLEMVRVHPENKKDNLVRLDWRRPCDSSSPSYEKLLSVFVSPRRYEE
jgi:hypothetical protein